MIRKSDYFEQTDKYLDAELQQPELSEFEAQKAFDPDLAEELSLHLEVGQALAEPDIAELRKNLGTIVQSNPGPRETSVVDSFSFGLAEELSSYQNMDRQASTNDISGLGLSFPKIHLYQHKIAGKENTHQFYREQSDPGELTGQEPFTPFDEDIFNGVQSALEENDIADIRANLGQIARSVPTHRYSSEEIEDFVAGRMAPEARALFEEELALNSALSADVGLDRETGLAVAESGVMQLRASLAGICKAGTNAVVRMEEIEGYMYNELSEDKMASFEAELSSNQSLAVEVDLAREIDQALRESDIMQLRGSLQGIAGDIAAQKQGQRSFATKTGARKILAASVAAASLAILLGITGLLSRQLAPAEIYREFHSTYQTPGTSRAAGTGTNQSLALALQKFDTREYGAALTLLRQAVSEGQNNAAAHFYTGAVLQETGRYEGAIGQYQTVISNGDNLFTEQARWYAALCYLQTGEDKKAYRQFKKIAQTQGFYGQRAKAILRKMKDTDQIN